MAENHVNGDYDEEDEEFSECSRFSLLDSLARRDEQGRAVVLDRLERALASWWGKTDGGEEEGEEEEVREVRKLLQDHLWTALALRWNAPFADIRERMNKLLEKAKVGRVCVWVFVCGDLML